MLFLFLVANAAKNVIFNALLLREVSVGFLLHKLFMTVLIIGALYPVLYLTRSRALMVAAYLLQALYIAAGITYFLYFHTYLYITQALALLSEVFSIAGNSAVRLDATALVSIMDLPFFLLFLRRYGRRRVSARRDAGSEPTGTATVCKPVGATTGRPLQIALTAVLVSLLAFSLSEAFCYANGKALVNLIHDTYSGDSPIVENYGTLAVNLVNLVHSRSGRQLEKQLAYGGEQVFKANIEPRPNIVAIQVESMDSAIVNQKYKGAYVMPYLHSLTRSAVWYPYVLSYHKGGGTSDSEFSIINSVEPLDCYPALKLQNYGYPNSLVTRLRENGYETMAFHGNSGRFYNRDVAFPKLGFGRFYDLERTGMQEDGWGLPDGELLSFALGKMAAAQKPFLSYVITMSSHEPFDSVRNYYSNSLYDGIADAEVRNYFNSMNYVDICLETFVNRIRSDCGNSYVFITGDHTPNIDKRDYRQASFSLDGRFFEFVPLFIITPDDRTHIEASKAASFLDLAPTFLKVSGTGCSIRTDGCDLLGSLEKAGVIPYRGASFRRGFLFQYIKRSANP